MKAEDEAFLILEVNRVQRWYRLRALRLKLGDLLFRRAFG